MIVFARFPTELCNVAAPSRNGLLGVASPPSSAALSLAECVECTSTSISWSRATPYVFWAISYDSSSDSSKKVSERRRGGLVNSVYRVRLGGPRECETGCVRPVYAASAEKGRESRIGRPRRIREVDI